MYNANIMLQMNDDFVQPRSAPSLLAVHGHSRPLPGAVVTLLAATHREKNLIKNLAQQRFASATRASLADGPLKIPLRKLRLWDSMKTETFVKGGTARRPFMKFK